MSSVYSVGQINAYIKSMFDQDFLLGGVSVRGEVSNCKYHTSGNIYFSLKDKDGVLACMMHASARSRLQFVLEDGQQVVVTGQVGVYMRGGRYQMYASQIRPDGLGELYERYEALRRELEEMGMFDEAYKKPIPSHPSVLGVVTASTGAAVRDIIQIAKRRDPGIRIIVCPAQVQGEGASASIARAIRALEQYGVDVMIVGRGGGSMEDLWAFNEEETARAIFACSVPVISAVGHETDTTIADFVADLRAPTPSAAAEIAVPDVLKTVREMERYKTQLGSLMQHHLRQEKGRLEQTSLRLKMNSPGQKVREQTGMLAEKEEALRRLMRARLDLSASALALRSERLRGLDPLLRLEQGYAYVEDKEGRRISRVSGAAEGEIIRLRMRDGSMEAIITKIDPAGEPGERI